MTPEPPAGIIALSNNDIVLVGAEPYALPATLTPEFVVSLFSTPPGADPTFIGNLASEIAPAERLRLYEYAKATGGTVWTIYRNNALKWRWLLNPDGEWHPERYEFVYQVEVGAAYSCSLISHLRISARGLRLATTPHGCRTFPEFEHIYGESVVGHLTSAMATLRKQAEARCAALDSIIPNITSDIVVKTIGVYTEARGIERCQVTGLASIPTNEWKLPEGMSFAYEDTQA